MIRVKKNTVLLPLLITFLTVNSIAQQRQNGIKPDQYRAINWSLEHGLSSYIANVMIKDAKGFLWVGSPGGELCRFDGTVFKKYLPDQQKGGTINSESIYSFEEDSLHNIWIGTANGLSRYDMKADTFSNFITVIDSVNSINSAIPFWSTSDSVYSLESGIRIVSYNIHSLKKKILLNLTLSDKIHRNGVGVNYTILDTVSNCLWMIESYSHNPERGGLLQISLDDGERKRYTWPCYRRNIIHRHSAEAIRFDRKRNSIWINSGDGLLEFSLYDKQFHHIDALNEFIKLKDYERYVGIDIDKEGKIWLATKPKGILIYDPKTEQVTQLFSDPDLLKKTGENNLHIYCDRDGIVWTSYWMQQGIYELLPYNPSVKRYTANPKMQDSLSNSSILTIVPGIDGQLWIGTEDGLNIFDPNTDKFQVLREKDLPGIKGNAIMPLHIDTIHQKAWLSVGPTGQVFGTDLYEMDIKTRKCRPINFRDKSKQFDTLLINPFFIQPYKNGLLIHDENYGLFEIKEGSLVAELVIPSKKIISRFVLDFTFENKNGKWIKIPHLLDSLPWIDMLYNEKDHTHWVSFKNELVHYDNDFGKIKSYNQEDGYNSEIWKMLIDKKGNLWFINKLRQVGHLNTATGIISTLSEADGYYKQDFDWHIPAAKDTAANLYFGGFSTGSKGLDRIHPERYSSVVTSSVYLRSLAINQKPFPLSTGVNNLEELSLNYNQNTISIETGIIDYYANGKGHIRYKLKSGDNEEDWQYGPAYYTIRYEKLPPGKYELVLQASNTGNEFNSAEKKLVISISPPFWQTWWFRTLAVIALLLLFYEIYRWRTATLRKQKRILEQTVKERTAEVVEEKAEVEKQKAKSDELLLNILPFEVAEELKEKGYTTAKSFDEVTILFSDIKGFTHVAEKLTAQELVKEIDTYFSAFDNIMQQYGLEKIKTIGDAYIAAGGLPEDNTATVQNVVEAAIAMQRAVEDLKKKRVENNLPYFELRIGIHTGPVVAGVVGIKKFQYDIWGDTVNLAARMEQSGVPGKINISKYTYEKVKDHFHCEHRGKIDAKNKGEIDMYFIISLK